MSSEVDSQVETAGVVLVRQSSDGPEVLLARRPAGRGFQAGFHGFVVGRVRETDDDVLLEPTGNYRAPRRAHWACAARELFEEYGLLASDEGWVGVWEESPAVEAPTGNWEEFRRGVRDDEIDFADALASAGLAIDVSDFHPVGRWSTPGWASIETTTEFFAVQAPDELDERVLESVDREEHHDPVWVAPGEAIRRWQEDEWFLSTPIRLILQGLAEMHEVCDRDLLPAANDQRGSTREMIEILGGLRMLPLSTPTLPPATHTNSYIVGDEALVLVDPGSGIAREQGLLHEALDELRQQGSLLETVVLTHHHDDHVDGVRGILEKFEPELAAHPETASRLPDELDVDRLLEDGQSIELGADGGHRLRAYHTPGHAPGHICLLHRPSRCLIAGDLVASEGTILIDPPEGNMGEYLASLEAMREVEPMAILPAHGSVIADARAHLEEYLSHRRKRERKVLEALEAAGQPVEPRDLVEKAYDDAPPAVWPLAVRSLHAHLIHLVERSLARRDDGRFVYD